MHCERLDRTHQFSSHPRRFQGVTRQKWRCQSCSVFWLFPSLISTEVDSSLPSSLKRQEWQNCKWLSQETGWPTGNTAAQGIRKLESFLKKCFVLSCLFVLFGVGGMHRLYLDNIHSNSRLPVPSFQLPKPPITFVSQISSFNNLVRFMFPLHTEKYGHPTYQQAHLQKINYSSLMHINCQ